MNSFWLTVTSTAVGTVIGGLISVGISAYYASKGSRELRNEANRLRETTELAIHYTDALISILEPQA